MFPNIFALGIKGLGPMTSKGSGLIMTAVVGGAIVPLALGAAADKFGIQHAFVIPLICYLFIAYYGMWGSQAYADSDSVGGLGAVNLKALRRIARRAFACLGRSTKVEGCKGWGRSRRFVPN